MKFDLILAQYLYQNKKLSLPGIGTFEADSTVNTTDENDKKKASLQGISFTASSVESADDELIEFIKVHTGKMKPLAKSDLESFITLGKQFLYIGKPFYLEGIGTLQLSKDRHLQFIPGEYITTKLEDPNLERSEGKKKSVREEDRIRKESSNNTIKKTALALMVGAVLGVLGWGAYHLLVNLDERSATSSMLLHDTVDTSLIKDSNAVAVTPVNAQSTPLNYTGTEQYKFVVETTYNKLRALNKFHFLRTYGKSVQLETPDSVFFKLYFMLPATAGDTLRIRDSLNRWYYGNSNTIRVRIE